MITKEYLSKYITGSSLDMNGIDILQSLIQKHKPESILELGSGVSTLAFLSAYEHFNTLYSVDDSQKYLQITKESVPKRLREKCNFILAPITTQYQYGYPFEIYSRSAIFDNVKTKIDLLFIDGPYARRYGRIGTLPIVSELLSDNCIIVLDDANRETEQQAINFWKKVWGNQLALIESHDFRKGLKIFQLKKPDKKTFMPFGLKRWAKSLIT